MPRVASLRTLVRAKRFAVIATIVAIVAVSTGCWFAIERENPARATTPFAVGYYENPPYIHIAADGSPTGLAVDVFREACRRRGIPIRWVRTPQGPDKALTGGQADLWTIVGNIEYRKRLFYVSEPWSTASAWLVTPSSSGIQSVGDTAGHSLWLKDVNMDK